MVALASLIMITIDVEFVAAFWTRVDKSTTPEGCWLWTGMKNPAGYGMCFDGKPIAAHRFSWNLAHPDNPCTGLVVCHVCDVPACVNPAHLFLGTTRINNHDKTMKGKPTMMRVLSPHPLHIEETHQQFAEPDEQDRIAAAVRANLPEVDIPARRVATEKAFRERDALVVALSKIWPSHLMRSPGRDPSFAVDYQWIVCIHSPMGPLAWRINDSQLGTYGHCERILENHWDGINTAQKYERLASLEVMRVPRSPVPHSKPKRRRATKARRVR